MLEILKRLSGRAPLPVAPVAEPVAPASVDNVDLSTLADTSLSGWFRQETDELFEGFPIRAEDSVLDIGCGDGPFVQFCAQRGA
jgi:2-polyprenyl-3-methyl-5-hydroxy-6-metoxy-1,4-benzoquinol methylase